MRTASGGERARRAIALVGVAIACSTCEVAASGGAAAGVRVDVVEPVAGIPDRGGDPAVVAIDVGGEMTCSGALLAPDIVVTARHCVSLVSTAQCPANGADPVTDRAPSSLRILVGDDTETAVEGARGRALFVPEGDAICGADIALVALDRPIDAFRPLAVRATGAALGARLRTVGFASGTGGPGAVKVVRDHVPVVDTTDHELRIVERSAEAAGGGPALDESSGDIVAVVSRAAAGGGAAVYTRADAFLSLVARAVAQGSPAPSTGLKARKGPADMGSHCSRGADCAAGACVIDGDKQYCSRACSAADRCPAHFRCERCDPSGTAFDGGPMHDSSLWACVQH